MIDRAINPDRQTDMFPITAGALVAAGASSDELDPGIRNRLDDVLKRIRTAQKAHINSGLEIGRLLLEAKRSLRHGSFMRWVREEVGISSSSAANYMNAAKLVDEFPMVGNLPPGSVYRLAKAPRPVIEAVVEDMRFGGTITDLDVVERCRAAKPSDLAPWNALAQKLGSVDE
jgi:hypothetical protein